jgi:hypothetical protein
VQSGDPRYVHNRDVYLVAWGTETIAADDSGTFRDQLFVTRSSDRGLSFERVQALHETRSAPDQTDEQIQLRTTPDGQNVSAVWIRKDLSGSSVMFASAVGITPTADLSVALTASDRQPDVGDAFDATIEVRNAGPQEATELQLTAGVGAGLEMVHMETAAGSCVVGATISCDLDNLASGGVAIINLGLVAETRGDWQITASTSAWEEEPEPGDNSAVLAGASIPNADIEVRAGTDSNKTRPGEEFGIEYGFTNHGPQVATGITVTVALNGSGEFVGRPDCAVDARTLTCSIAELTVGQSWSGTADVRAIAGAKVSVYVTATSVEKDPVSSDNSMEVSVPIDSPEPGVGGGCAYDPNGRGDTTLPAMLLLAMLARWWRRRAAGLATPARRA